MYQALPCRRRSCSYLLSGVVVVVAVVVVVYLHDNNQISYSRSGTERSDVWLRMTDTVIGATFRSMYVTSGISFLTSTNYTYLL